MSPAARNVTLPPCLASFGTWRCVPLPIAEPLEPPLDESFPHPAATSATSTPQDSNARLIGLLPLGRPPGDHFRRRQAHVNRRARAASPSGADAALDVAV